MSKKVLLADDSITIHKVISITFADEDFDLRIVGDGDAAIAEVREFVPDLVMADVSMPGKSGYEVCESIKSDPRLSHTPVLILAGTFEPIDSEELTRVGADDCIVKPFESQELIDKVHALLEKNATPGVAEEGEREESGFDPGESGAPVIEEALGEPSESWDERDLLIAETVEEKTPPVELSGDDTVDCVTAEDVAEEPEKENLRKIVAEEFEELDLGGGDVETIEELEEIKEVEELWEEDEAAPSLPEDEAAAIESEPTGESGSSDDGGAGEALISELESDAEVAGTFQDVEELTDIQSFDGEGDVDLPSDGAPLSPPWLSDVAEEDGVNLSEIDAESDDEVTEDEAVSFDIPPSEFNASEEFPIDETSATDLDEADEPQPFETADSDDEAQPEESESLEIPEPELEPFEGTTEPPLEEAEESGVEEGDVAVEGTVELEPQESPIGFEAVAPSGDEVELPSDVEAEEVPSCEVVEPDPQPEPEAEDFQEEVMDEEPAVPPEGLVDTVDTADVEAALEGEDEGDTALPEPVVEPEELERGEDREEDEEETAVPPETVAANAIDREKLEEIVTRVARSVLEEVAWEGVPEMVAEMVKEELRKRGEGATDRE